MTGARVNIRVRLFGLTIITWEMRDSLSQIVAGPPKSENSLLGFICENNSAEYACFSDGRWSQYSVQYCSVCFILLKNTK